MKDLVAPVLDFRLSSERVKLLRARGADGHAFSLLRKPFTLVDALESISPLVPEWLPEDFRMPGTSVKRQIDGASKLLSNPLHGAPIICIGSMPSDTRAKFFALSIMNAAVEQMLAGSHKGRTMPIWHKVMGGYYDSIRDDKERPHYSMLILSNVGRDSTPQKIEKVRDLLEMYDSIPRIVVVNGCDPVTFFAEKIRLSLRYAFMLNAKDARPTSIMDI